jgi:hypothetical protein
MTHHDDGAIISPTLDDAIVDATRALVTGLRADGHSIAYTSQVAAEHLAEQVAAYREVREAMHGVSPACEPDYVHDAYDPTDAELEAMWAGPDAHEAHRAAWALHVEVRS